MPERQVLLPEPFVEVLDALVGAMLGEVFPRDCFVAAAAHDWVVQASVLVVVEAPHWQVVLAAQALHLPFIAVGLVLRLVLQQDGVLAPFAGHLPQRAVVCSQVCQSELLRADLAFLDPLFAVPGVLAQNPRKSQDLAPRALHRLQCAVFLMRSYFFAKALLGAAREPTGHYFKLAVTSMAQKRIIAHNLPKT